MANENHFESWNKTIKEVYGNEETDSLRVANEGSIIVKQGCSNCESIEPVTEGSVGYYSNICDNCYRQLSEAGTINSHISITAIENASDYAVRQENKKTQTLLEEQRNRLDVQLVKFNAEKKLIEAELKDKLLRARRLVESLHTKVENGDEISESDGLQGLGSDIDSLKSRLKSYNEFIKYLEEFGKTINK
ncbi:chromosome segregation protein [Bacillus toyonensis]|uniref:chromosome segregation protein n=1 Tax=Bacillus toyonensis TaxID=155322 RepID=UPI00211D514B|nr:chromosome segregation protein [Bacillus toyonensis]